MTSPRQPESNIEVYNLGHYEQMQIDIALQVVTTGQPNDLLDIATLKGLQAIFAAFGTLTVTRVVDLEPAEYEYARNPLL